MRKSADEAKSFSEGGLAVRRKVAFALGATTLALPACFLAYDQIAVPRPLTWPGAVDAAAFALATALALLALNRLPKTTLRITAACLLSVALSFIYLGNVVYYDVFHDWVHFDVLMLWKVGLPVLGNAVTSLGFWDWLAGGAAPLVLAILATVSHRRRALRVIWLSAIGLLLGAVFVHIEMRASTFHPSEHNVVMNIVREGFSSLSGSSKQRVSTNESIWDYYPRPGAGYAVDADPSRPLLKTPNEGPAPKPLFRIRESHLPNVVLVLMESIRAYESGAYGMRPSFTPELDALAAEGLLFRNFYANGSQTVRAELALLFSYYPNFDGPPVYLTRPNVKLSSLLEILVERGYTTCWISSFSKDYHEKARFLGARGMQTFHDGSDLPPDTPKIGWGPPDHVMFQYAEQILDKQPQPFFAEIMTLSNHWDFKWDYPTIPQTPAATGDADYIAYTRGIYYTDWAIGRFMERMRAKPYFDNTIFIFCGDHAVWIFPDTNTKTVQKQEAYFRMPLILYAPSLLPQATSYVIGSQVDVAPTILHMLGIRAQNAFVGRSLFASSSGNGRYALMMHVHQWHLRIGNQYVYDIGREVFIEHFPRVREVNPRSSNRRVCFSTDQDLLRLRNADALRIASNEETQRHTVWGRSLISLSQALLEQNRVY